jgi:hypothetical protein
MCLVGGCLAALVVAVVVPLGCTNGSDPAGRKLLGLFSEHVIRNMVGKIPVSEHGKIRNVKLFVKWKDLEAKHKGAYNWKALDSKVNGALSIGVNSILITLIGPVPNWATNWANPKPAYNGPPKKMQDWQDFCHAVAARYKGYVDYYQVWQEAGWDANSGSVQTGTVYYAGDTSYTYLGMLRAGYKGIKSADPDAQVISASLLSKLEHKYSNFSYYETLLAGSNQDFSMKITSNQNIIAQRPGGTDEPGAPKPRTTWSLTGGSTRSGSQQYLNIQNPGDTPAKVTITYTFTDGTTQNQKVNLQAKSRTTIDVNHSLSMAAICDQIAIHPYDYPNWWGWYYKTLRKICKKYNYGGREISVTEIGWPHKYVMGGNVLKGYNPEVQRRAIGEVGLGGLWKAGCKKIWVFEDVDPASSWDGQYDGLFSNSGRAWPAWNEYEKWQEQLPNYGNKPDHLGTLPASSPAGSTPRRSKN